MIQLLFEVLPILTAYNVSGNNLNYLNMYHNFGSIVVVENNLVGVVVKCWGVDNHGNEAKSEVYVRSYNGIKTYPNSEVKQFIFDKEISDEDMEFYE